VHFFLGHLDLLTARRHWDSFFDGAGRARTFGWTTRGGIMRERAL
jgi:hypothetical protein